MTTRRPSRRARPVDDGRVVAEQPVAVQLDELVGHGPDEFERARAAQVARQLDAGPDRVAGVRGLRGRVRRATAAIPIECADLADALGERAQERERSEARHVDLRPAATGLGR